MVDQETTQTSTTVAEGQVARTGGINVNGRIIGQPLGLGPVIDGPLRSA